MRRRSVNRGIFGFFLYVLFSILLHLPPSDSTVSEDSGIEPRTVAISASAVRRSNHSARSPHPIIRCERTQRIKQIGLVWQKDYERICIHVGFVFQVSFHSYYNIKWSLESSGIGRRQADQWCVTASVFKFNSGPMLVLIISDFANNSTQSYPAYG